MQVSDLRGILQYIPRFRDRTFVIAIDGEIIESENFSNVLLDLAVLRSLSIRVVIVHGARHQIEQRAAELPARPSRTPTARASPTSPTLAIALDASTRVTHEIMEGLTSVDLRAVYANAVIAYPAGILGGVDQLYTGRVDRVDAASLQLFLDQGMIPIVPPARVRRRRQDLPHQFGHRRRGGRRGAARGENHLPLRERRQLAARRRPELVRQLSVEEAEETVKNTG